MATINYVYAILAAVLVAYLVVPILNLIPVVAGTNVIESFGRPAVIDSLLVSLFTASVSASASAFFGVPLAYLLARREFRGKSLISLLVVLPLVLPPLISGTAILLVFSNFGLSQTISQTVAGIILAQVYVASPFMIISARIAIEDVDEGYEHMSHVLGKSEFETFRRITLPLAKRGIVAGFILTWIRALGELGATLVVAYVPHTISIQAWQDYLSSGVYAAVPDVVLVLLVTVGILSLIKLTRSEVLQPRKRRVEPPFRS